MPKLPLQGVRVLDHGIVFAGPTGATALADMGAEVIHVESHRRFPTATRGGQPFPTERGPNTTSWMQGYPLGEPGEDPWNRNAAFNGINRNKSSVTLELNTPEGRDLYTRLVKLSDIIIENFSGGSFDRMGYGYPYLSSVNPGIILISMAGFGGTGPYKNYGSFGSNVDAIAGHTILRGYKGDDPDDRSGMVWPDNVGGITAAVAVLSALYRRTKSGHGQFIDMSQAETFITHSADSVLDFTMNGRVAEPMENRDPVMAPQGCYPCAGDDKWVVISVRDDADWRALCGVMGDPEWSRDPRYASVLGRHEHHDALDAFIAAWTQERSNTEAMSVLQAAGVPASPVMGPAALHADPHLAARDYFHEMDHPSVGRHRYPGQQWKFSKTPLGPVRPAPLLGQHNAEVLGGLLGLSAADLEDLTARRLIGTAYPRDVVIS
ncbi:MAG: CoA transferase [Chloroflexi bacterium]|nr:CoA transferase [Chloroflexota bacterium]